MFMEKDSQECRDRVRHEATNRFFEKGLNVMEVATITGHKEIRLL